MNTMAQLEEVLYWYVLQVYTLYITSLCCYWKAEWAPAAGDTFLAYNKN